MIGKNYIAKIAKGDIKVIGVTLVIIGIALWGVKEVQE
jgi:hypothetical protein